MKIKDQIRSVHTSSWWWGGVSLAYFVLGNLAFPGAWYYWVIAFVVPPLFFVSHEFRMRRQDRDRAEFEAERQRQLDRIQRWQEKRITHMTDGRTVWCVNGSAIPEADIERLDDSPRFVAEEPWNEGDDGLR